jgi:hypothetical protein
MFTGIPLFGLTPVLDVAAENKRRAQLRAVLLAIAAFVLFLIVKKRKA